MAASERVSLESIFPGLKSGAYRVTSPRSAKYNCIAWAAGDDAYGTVEAVLERPATSITGDR